MTDTNNNVEKSGPVTSRKEEKDMTEETNILPKKLTAADFERNNNLPSRLTAIGKEIEAKLSKADNYHAKASDMVDSDQGVACRSGGILRQGWFRGVPQTLLSVPR